jgi:CRP-like cAMP-binding protein
MIESMLKLIGDKYAPLSKECQNDLIQLVTMLNKSKGTNLIREGQYADQVYYIVKGCARAYYLDDGRDISDWFAFENGFISSIISFSTGEPSPHYVEVLEDSVLLEFSKLQIEDLAKRHHDFEHLMRVILTETAVQQRTRISSILFQKAEQRYEKLLDIYPGVLQRVPLTHIASYLGITLETSSRIRRPNK